MNSNNRIGVDDKTAENFDRTQSQTALRGHRRRRKSIWILFCILVLLGLIIITLLIFVKPKTTSIKNTSTTEESTIGIMKTTEITTESTTEELLSAVVVDINTHWKNDASTVAGGNDKGQELHQLDHPDGIYVDDEDRSIYISDSGNHRIVRWKFGAKNGEVVAGGNGAGSEMNQLKDPSDVIVDKKDNSLIICDHGNSRVIRWYHGDDKNRQILILGYTCWGLAMNKNGDLYVSNSDKNEVRRWKQGVENGTIVAGGNGRGNGLNQLNGPRHIFVDEDYSVYVADFFNARLMKWTKHADEGFLVGRSQVLQSSPDYPHRLSGVIIDPMGNVYVSDTTNCQITRWSPGAIKGSSVAGEFGCGTGREQLFFPFDLSFDRQGNLYIADTGNNRIQKFAVDLN